MKVTQVMVEFEKRVNDGNYGSEHATVQYVALVEDGEDPDDIVRQLVTRGREKVVAELGGSESLTVRRALNPPKRLCSECGQELGDEDDYYHPPCQLAYQERYKREQQEREERYRRQRAEWDRDLPATSEDAEQDEEKEADGEDSSF